MARRVYDEEYDNTILTSMINSTNGDFYFAGAIRHFYPFDSTERNCLSNVMRYSPTNYNIAPPSTSAGNWTEYGGGMFGETYIMAANPAKGYMFLGGNFARFGNIPNAANAVYFSNGEWHKFNIPYSPVIWDAVFDGDNILAGAYSAGFGLNTSLGKANISGPSATWEYLDSKE